MERIDGSGSVDALRLAVLLDQSLVADDMQRQVGDAELLGDAQPAFGACVAREGGEQGGSDQTRAGLLIAAFTALRTSCARKWRPVFTRWLISRAGRLSAPAGPWTTRLQANSGRFPRASWMVSSPGRAGGAVWFTPKELNGE
jgi:hypothetical protein